jgi:hypothetical protein
LDSATYGLIQRRNAKVAGSNAELAFLADMKTAIGDAMAAHPFSDFVDPNTDAHTSFRRGNGRRRAEDRAW